MAESPETSDFTSTQDRIASCQAQKNLQAHRAGKDSLPEMKTPPDQAAMLLKAQLEANRDHWLSPIKRRIPSDEYIALNLSCEEYLELLDWTGRHIKAEKKGTIPENLAPILTRLDIETEEWLNTVMHFGNLFYRVAGSVRTIIKAAQQAGQKWLKGKTPAKNAFG